MVLYPRPEGTLFLLFNPALDAFVDVIACGRAAFDVVLKLAGAVADAVIAGLTAVTLADHDF